MAFGQSAGPAASHWQVAELLELLQNAGHADFKDARGPMGLRELTSYKWLGVADGLIRE